MSPETRNLAESALRSATQRCKEKGRKARFRLNALIDMKHLYVVHGASLLQVKQRGTVYYIQVKQKALVVLPPEDDGDECWSDAVLRLYGPVERDNATFSAKSVHKLCYQRAE